MAYFTSHLLDRSYAALSLPFCPLFPSLSLSLSPHRYTNISQYFTRLITTTNALCNSIKIQQLKRIKSFLKDFEIAKIFSTRCTIVHALKCIPQTSPPFSSFLSHPRPSKPFHASSSHHPSTKLEQRERLNEQPCFIHEQRASRLRGSRRISRTMSEKQRERNTITPDERRYQRYGGRGGGEGRWQR